MPRIHGESIYGATARGANLIAADLCEDEIEKVASKVKSRVKREKREKRDFDNFKQNCNIFKILQHFHNLA